MADFGCNSAACCQKKSSQKAVALNIMISVDKNKENQGECCKRNNNETVCCQKPKKKRCCKQATESSLVPPPCLPPNSLVLPCGCLAMFDDPQSRFEAENRLGLRRTNNAEVQCGPKPTEDKGISGDKGRANATAGSQTLSHSTSDQYHAVRSRHHTQNQGKPPGHKTKTTTAGSQTPATSIPKTKQQMSLESKSSKHQITATKQVESTPSSITSGIANSAAEEKGRTIKQESEVISSKTDAMPSADGTQEKAQPGASGEIIYKNSKVNKDGVTESEIKAGGDQQQVENLEGGTSLPHLSKMEIVPRQVDIITDNYGHPPYSVANIVGNAEKEFAEVRANASRAARKSLEMQEIKMPSKIPVHISTSGAAPKEPPASLESDFKTSSEMKSSTLIETPVNTSGKQTGRTIDGEFDKEDVGVTKSGNSALNELPVHTSGKQTGRTFDGDFDVEDVSVTKSGNSTLIETPGRTSGKQAGRTFDGEFEEEDVIETPVGTSGKQTGRTFDGEPEEEDLCDELTAVKVTKSANSTLIETSYVEEVPTTEATLTQDGETAEEECDDDEEEIDEDGEECDDSCVDDEGEGDGLNLAKLVSLDWNTWDKLVSLINGEPIPNPCMNRCDEESEAEDTEETDCNEECTDDEDKSGSDGWSAGRKSSGGSGGSYERSGLMLKTDTHNQETYILFIALPLVILGLMASFKDC